MALVLNPTVGTVNNAGVGTSVVVPTPAGFAAGDLLLCVVNTDSKSVILTAPAGWTLLLNVKTSVSLGNQFSVWTRVADGTEGASATVALSKSVQANGAMYAASGQDAAAPVNVWATQDTPTANVSHAAPSVTPTVAGCLLISVVSAYFNGTYTAPATMTLGSSQANTDTTCGTASEAYAGGTAATGTRTFTATGSAASIGATIAIAPAVGFTFRGAAQASAATSSSVVVAAPTGTRNGDLLVADVAARSGAAGAPAGWTLIRGTTVSGGQVATYVKIAAREGASFTFTGSYGVAASVLCFVSGDPPVLDVEDGQSNAASTSIAAPSIATRQDADLLIWTGGVITSSTSSSAPVISAPSDMTLPANGAAKATAYVSVASAYLLNQPLGATGTKVGAAGGATPNAGHLAAFASAASGGAPAALAAPVATGTGAAPVPSLAVSSSRGAPTLSGAGTAPAPAVIVSSTVAAPVATGSGLLSAPTVTASQTLAVRVPALSGSGTLPAATLSGVSVTVPAPTLTGAGALAAPAVQAGGLLRAGVLSGSGASPAPSPRISPAVAAPTLTGAAALPAPTSKIGLSASALTGTGTLPSAASAVSTTVVSPVLTGSAVAPGSAAALAAAPPVLAGSGAAGGPALTATTRALAPVLSGLSGLPAAQVVAMTPVPDHADLFGARPRAIVSAASVPFAVLTQPRPSALVTSRAPSARIA